MPSLAELLAESLSAKGTRSLAFEQMLSVLQAGHEKGLRLFSVDVTTLDGAWPLPEWMFRLTKAEALELPRQQIVPMALDFYAANATNTDLQEAGFQVYFETAG